MKYAIQCLFAYGWDYTGSEDGKRPLYDSAEAAQDEVNDLTASMGYNKDEWRVVKYTPSSDSKSDL